MRLVVKKRDITDVGHLRTLVTDNVDGIEAGLSVLDSRLLLGQATIDVVGLDARGALVLMALGFTADEEMLLKAVEAYSWCLEYPEAIRRLYPSAQISSSHPPRLMFVVERMPDSFLRKIKQLGFPEVDCIEFRYLDVDGAPAMYFETLARLRRAPVADPPAPERVVTPAASVTTGRPTSVKLQKLLGGDRSTSAREPAQVVRMVHRTTPRAETSKPVLSKVKMDGATAPRLVQELFGARPAAVESPAAELTAPAEAAEIESASEPVVAPILTLEAVPEPPEPMSAEPTATSMALAEPLDVPLLEPERDLTPAVADEPLPVDAASADVVVSSEPLAPGLAPEPELTWAPLASMESHDDPREAEPVPAPALDIEPSLALVATPAPTPEPGPAGVPQRVAAEPVLEQPAEAPVEADAPAITPAPAPSVFSRRPADAVAPASEPKVSFATAAKDLLAVTTPPAPRAEAPVTVPQPSVEEITRGALDELVAPAAKPAAEERTTAFAKPGGAFSRPAGAKRPLTIAPPPPDPQPIAAGPKLGAAPKRTAPAAAKPEPAGPAAAAPEPTSPMPTQGVEGLQFPNDGVLTRQWMEFLNQMAAGK
jgi:hypothetical protein